MSHLSTSSSSALRSVTVLVPALNEEGNIGPTITALARALTETVDEYEIIVVNDGSTDGTGTAAELAASGNSAVRVIHNQRNMGIGHAYSLGCTEAHLRYFVYIPGDNTWPYLSLVALFRELGKADIVLSYSLNPEVRPLGRRIVSDAYTWTLNSLFGHDLPYYNGLNIYPGEFVRSRPVTTFGFGFQAEVLLKAKAAGLSHTAVGLNIDERASGGSKAVRLGNILSVAATVLRLFWRLRVLGQR